MRRKILRAVGSVLVIMGGNTLYAAAVALFVIPLGLITCGTTGLALFINRMTGFSITWFTYLFYGGMFLLGLIFLGRRFALTTLVSTVWYPVVFMLFERFLDGFSPTDNLMLGTIYAGLMIGCAVGIVLRAGASTGGTDIPPLIAHKYLRIPISVGIWVLDVLILFSQMFTATSEEILYGLLLVLLYSVLINRVLLFGRDMMEVQIISDKQTELTKAILSEVDRGVTLLHGKTGYAGQEVDIVMTVVGGRELTKVEHLTRRIDPSAFMIVHSVSDVRGYGFSSDKQYRSKAEQERSKK